MKQKTELIQVGELALGFSENAMPATTALKGKCLQLNREDGSAVSLEFKDGSMLSWREITKGKGKTAVMEGYRATRPRRGIYFVDFVRSKMRATSVSLVLDFRTGTATEIVGTLPSEAEARMDKLTRAAKGLPQTAVTVRFNSAAIDRSFAADSPRHPITDELIG